MDDDSEIPDGHVLLTVAVHDPHCGLTVTHSLPVRADLATGPGEIAAEFGRTRRAVCAGAPRNTPATRRAPTARTPPPPPTVRKGHP